MFTGILSLVSAAVGIGGEYLKGKQTITAAKAAKTAELISKQTDNDHEWETQALQERDNFLRRACFVMFALPFVWAAFDPKGVQAYFEVALAGVPDWYVKAFLAMVGSIWGAVEIKRLFSGRRK